MLEMPMPIAPKNFNLEGFATKAMLPTQQQIERERASRMAGDRNFNSNNL